MSLSHADLLKLKRWNSPTISNALEQITAVDRLALPNREETRDFMPEMGPMVGYAVTVAITAGDPKIKVDHPGNFQQFREYMGSVPGPKIVVLQDLDKPACHGSMWGEVGANGARALGCVGTITDGAIRDLDEMKNAGFKALARRQGQVRAVGRVENVIPLQEAETGSGTIRMSLRARPRIMAASARPQTI